jgi:hypothetical protein
MGDGVHHARIATGGPQDRRLAGLELHGRREPACARKYTSHGEFAEPANPIGVRRALAALTGSNSPHEAIHLAGHFSKVAR